jgi:hypothetical protein
MWEPRRPITLTAFMACYRNIFTLPNFFMIVWFVADHRGRAVWGVKCLRLLKHWTRGFESHWRHECLPAFIVFVLSCVSRGLAMGWSPVEGVLQTLYKIHTVRINSELEQARGPNSSKKKKKREKYSLIFFFINITYFWKRMLLKAVSGTLDSDSEIFHLASFRNICLIYWRYLRFCTKDG